MVSHITVICLILFQLVYYISYDALIKFINTNSLWIELWYATADTVLLMVELILRYDTSPHINSTFLLKLLLRGWMHTGRGTTRMRVIHVIIWLWIRPRLQGHIWPIWKMEPWLHNLGIT